MKELAIQQPELIGRESELSKLKQSLDNAIAGKGSTIFIAGEAGIGKTRLVSELINNAETKNVQIIQGRCLLESLEPLMPIKTALREAGLFHLISGEAPPLVVSVYLLNSAGLLIAKYEREELGLDPHIFGSMLTAVGNFVKDSMQKMDNIEQTGGLNSLGFKEYKILVEESGELHLAAVTKGSFSEFLVSDMRVILADILCKYGSVLKDWDGDMEKVDGIEPMVSPLITSGKYEGRFLVDDPRIRQENVFDNVLLGLQRLSANRPLLIFLDDLQWADPSTLALLHYLARNTRKDKVLIVGDYRPEDIAQQYDGKPHQLETAMQNMGREDLLEKIELNRLDKTGTEELVNKTLGTGHFEKEFYDRIYIETDGTPFFVLEIVKLLVEEGWIKQDNKGIWNTTTGLEKMDIPSKVYDVVKRRLDRLKKDQREILDCASVVGEEFQTDIIGKTMDLNKLALLKNLSEIEKTHRLIHSMEKKFRFDHAKVREVLYDEIIDELKLEYHRLIADTIHELHKDDLDEVMSELAVHYLEAKDARARDYLIKAGDQAKGRYANEEAIRLYKKALEIINDSNIIKDCHIKIGDVSILIGNLDVALNNYQVAMEFGVENKSKAELHRKIAKVYSSMSKWKEYLEECEKGLAIIQDEVCIEKARLLGQKGLAIPQGNWRMMKGLFDEELKIAEILQDKDEISQAHFHLSKMYFEYTGESHEKQMKEALTHLDIALKLREELGDKIKISDTLSEIGLCYHNIGNLNWSGTNEDWNRAIDYYNKSLEIKKEIGDNRGIAFIYFALGVLHRNNDEFDKALQHYNIGLTYAKKTGIKRQIAQIISFIGELAELKGHIDEALKFHHQAYTINMSVPDNDVGAYELLYIGHLHEMKGELEQALQNYNKGVELILYDDFIKKKRLSGFYGNIARIYVYQHKYKEALKTLQIGMETTTIFDPERNEFMLRCLAELYFEMGNFSEALRYTEESLNASAMVSGKNWTETKSFLMLGMLNREYENWDKAIDFFEKVKSRWEMCPFGKENIKECFSRLFYEYGLLWKAKGDYDKARENLEKALKLYSELNWKLWADKCKKALGELQESS